MKIPLLMTGATGLVGSRFVELYEDKYEIFNIDLTTGVDITSKDSLTSFVATHKASCLVHLAAYTNTAEADKQKGDENGICYQVNVIGTQNIAEICKKNDIHLIHISTDFVFDGAKETPYTEEDPISPLDWYGVTKGKAEEVVENSGVGYTIIRIAYPYRASYSLKPDIIAKLKLGIEAGTLPPQFADTTINPTFVDDIAKGLDLVVTNPKIGIYHLVGSSAVSPYELAVLVAQHYGFAPSIIKRGSLSEYQKTNSRPLARYANLSNKKFINDYGFIPKTLPEGLVALGITQVK